MAKTYKIVLLGDRKVGKTSFIKQIIDKKFIKEYEETIKVNMYEMCIDKFISYKDLNIRFNIWDCVGDIDILKRKDYLYGADGAIIFFDLSNQESYVNVKLWEDYFKSICPNSQITIVANKNDIKNFNKCSNINISVKNSYNIIKPIVNMYRKIEINDSRKDLEPKSSLYSSIKYILTNDNDSEDYINFLQDAISEALKIPKQVTNYKLISSNYDKEISNEVTEKCEKIANSSIDMFDMLDELTDDEIIILITLKYFEEINQECYFTKGSPIDKLLNRLARIYTNENYHYFFKLFMLATNYSFNFENGTWKFN